MLKNLKDFPELEEEDLLNLNLSHFKKGLDPSLAIKTEVHCVNNMNEAVNLKIKVPILYMLLRSRYNENGIINRTRGFNLGEYSYEYMEQVIEYAKEKILELVKKNLMSQELLDNMAKALVSDSIEWDFIKFMIESNLIDVNLSIGSGDSLFFYTKEKGQVNYLVENGCNILFKMTNKDSKYLDMTPYDVALKMKKSNWSQYLKAHMPIDIVSKKENEVLLSLQTTTKISQQLKVCMVALKNNDLPVFNEIFNHQDKYKDLIEYEDGHGKNLLFHTISNGTMESFSIIIVLDVYKNNKERVNRNNICYTSYACEKLHHSMAEVLYDRGFKQDASLEKTLNLDCRSHATILDKMIEDGFQPSLSLLFNNTAIKNISTVLNKMTPIEIEEFFKSKKEYLSWNEVEKYQNGWYYLKSKNNTVCVSYKGFYLILQMLQKQEKEDNVSFVNNFRTVVQSAGNNDKKMGIMLTNLIYKFFPNEDKLIRDYISVHKKEWVIIINKEYLEKELNKVEIVVPTKRMKI